MLAVDEHISGWRRWSPWLWAAAASVITVAAYWPATRYAFLNFDDDGYVTANEAVRRGLTLDSARWAFTHFSQGHYHPLTWLSHQLDVSLFGLDAGAHHRTSILWHGLNAALCFALLRRLFADLRPAGALLAALMFSLHPLRLESVAWVACRKDVLSGAFFFTTALGYLWCRERPSGRRWAVVTASFALALLAKPSAATLPFVLLLLDVWPLARNDTWRVRVTEKASLFLLSAASVLTSMAAQAAAGAVQPTPLNERLAHAAVSLWQYAWRAVAPLPISIFHPWHETSLVVGAVAGAALLASLWAALRWRTGPLPVRVGWLWFVGMLLPFTGLVRVGGQGIADRWLYLPGLGLLVAAVGVARLPVVPQAARAVAAMAACAACAWATFTLLPVFRDSEAVFRQALSADADNFMAHTNLGVALEARGATEEAEAHYVEALRLNPMWPTALNNLATAEARRGQLQSAIARWELALERQPDFARAHQNLGLAYTMVGELPRALPHYQRAVELEPQNAQALLGLGACLSSLGRAGEGVPHLRRALELDATAEAHAHLARGLRMSNDLPGALEHALAALQLDAQQPVARSELATLEQLGQR